jgi:hypothetical protein
MRKSGRIRVRTVIRARRKIREGKKTDVNVIPKALRKLLPFVT